jgi:hypothetical protein
MLHPIAIAALAAITVASLSTVSFAQEPPAATSPDLAPPPQVPGIYLTPQARRPPYTAQGESRVPSYDESPQSGPEGPSGCPYRERKLDLMV